MSLPADEHIRTGAYAGTGLLRDAGQAEHAQELLALTRDRQRADLDSDQLFFMAPDSALMSASVEQDGPSLRSGNRARSSRCRNSALIEPSRRFGVSPDGTRFLMNLPVAAGAPTITLFVNWQASLPKARSDHAVR